MFLHAEYLTQICVSPTIFAEHLLRKLFFIPVNVDSHPDKTYLFKGVAVLSTCVSFLGTLSFHDGMVTQNVQMDFFNYAGIHRPVKLYIMPAAINLEDVSITASIDEDQNTAEVTFDLVVSRIFFY